MTIYKTKGRLTSPVSDRDSAQEYLTESNMTQFVDDDLPVTFVEWKLTSDQAWECVVVTSRDFTDDESARMSDWICGQNSDGLGEGFEQQAFAEAEREDRFSDWDDEDEDWDDVECASFDWMDNECILEKQ